MRQKKQRWTCPQCGREYLSPIRVKSIQCGGNHNHLPPNKRQVFMKKEEE